MVYLPPIDRYWAVIKLETGAVAWTDLDPTTTRWTRRPLVQSGAIPSLSGGNTLVRRRMLWMPKLHAALFLGSADKNISAYRF